MISDILLEAQKEIDRYLSECPDAYPEGHPVTKRIIALRDQLRFCASAPI